MIFFIHWQNRFENLLQQPDFFLGWLTLVLILIFLVGLRMLLPLERRATLRFPFFCLLVLVGLEILTLGVSLLTTFTSLVTTLEGLALLVILVILARIATLFTFEVVASHWFKRKIPKILADIVQAVLYASVIAYGLRLLGVQLTSLLVTSALLTAVIGLALQETLGNLVSGLTLQAQQPFELGDWIQLEGRQSIGEVTEVNWRATKILTLDRVEVIIPNGVLAKNDILNYTKPTPVVRRNIYVYSRFSTPPQRVHELILEALSETPEVLKSPAPSVVTNKFLDNGTTEYWVRFFIDAFHRRDIIDGRVRDRIWYALERAEIEPAFATSHIIWHKPEQVHQRTVEIQDVKKHLVHIPYFDKLPTQALEKLAERIDRKLYAPGELIIRQGDEGRDFFILQTGEVSILINQVEVNQLQAGAYFGEMSLLTGEPRSASIRAKTEVVLYVLDPLTFGEVLRDYPHLASEISRTLAQRQIQLDQLREKEDSVEEEVERKSTQFLDKIKRFFSF
ncbi:MAG: mechanosensitive ion channel [Blastocatellia bacterium]|nr:mechanosensitive ion channel [Blastocatellia bacterium]